MPGVRNPSRLAGLLMRRRSHARSVADAVLILAAITVVDLASHGTF